MGVEVVAKLWSELSTEVCIDNPHQRIRSTETCLQGYFLSKAKKPSVRRFECYPKVANPRNTSNVNNGSERKRGLPVSMANLVPDTAIMLAEELLGGLSGLIGPFTQFFATPLRRRDRHICVTSHPLLFKCERPVQIWICRAECKVWPSTLSTWCHHPFVQFWIPSWIS